MLNLRSFMELHDKETRAISYTLKISQITLLYIGKNYKEIQSLKKFFLSYLMRALSVPHKA